MNIEADTPVERLAREMGEEQIPEVGRTATRKEQRREREREAAQREGNGAPKGEPVAHVDTNVPVPPDEAQRTLIARREHSKGDENLPTARPHPGLLDERPEDRMARDLPKERDDRSAPKGNVTKGQAARNPDLEARDDFKLAERPPRSGFLRASDAADEATKPRTATPPKPTARRSSAAKRKLTTAGGRGGGAAANVRKAPKSAERSGRRAAVKRRPQVGKRSTGTARRGDAVPRAARGNVSARKARKASESRAKSRRAKRSGR